MNITTTALKTGFGTLKRRVLVYTQSLCRFCVRLNFGMTMKLGVTGFHLFIIFRGYLITSKIRDAPEWNTRRVTKLFCLGQGSVICSVLERLFYEDYQVTCFGNRTFL